MGPHPSRRKFLDIGTKGKDDICMVFDATMSRLNNYLWDPNFMLLLNGKFAYDGGSGDTHDRSICWGNVL